MKYEIRIVMHLNITVFFLIFTYFFQQIFVYALFYL